MQKVIIPSIALVSIALLIIILNSTNPVTAGPMGILSIFVLTYIVIVIIIAYVIHFVSYLISYLSTSLISKKPFQTVDLRKSYYYSSVFSAAPVMLIGLQSVGSVGLYELFLVSIFITIGCLYISKRIN